MENIEDPVGNFGKGGGGKDGVFGDAIAADAEAGDKGEVSGSDQGRVALELHQFPGANQDGSKFEERKSLSGSGRDGGLHVEEG